MTLREPTHESFQDPEKVEMALARILRRGVLLSFALMSLGFCVMLIRHPDYLSDPQSLSRLTSPGAAFPHSLGDVAKEILQGRGRAMMTLGLLILILTPVLRVLVSAAAFAAIRDWRYFAITAGVFTTLIISMLLGLAH